MRGDVVCGLKILEFLAELNLDFCFVSEIENVENNNILGTYFLPKMGKVNIMWIIKVDILFHIFQVVAFPQEEDQSSASSGGLGEFFKSAAKAVDEHKVAALSAIGLEEGKEGQALTTILKGLNIDSTIITNLRSSFTGQEGFTTLMDAFKNPEKLQTLLADKTGMDNKTIEVFMETIKNKFKPE